MKEHLILQSPDNLASSSSFSLETFQPFHFGILSLFEHLVSLYTPPWPNLVLIKKTPDLEISTIQFDAKSLQCLLSSGSLLTHPSFQTAIKITSLFSLISSKLPDFDDGEMPKFHLQRQNQPKYHRAWRNAQISSAKAKPAQISSGMAQCPNLICQGKNSPNFTGHGAMPKILLL